MQTKSLGEAYEYDDENNMTLVRDDGPENDNESDGDDEEEDDNDGNVDDDTQFEYKHDENESEGRRFALRI